jgi:hypothetical protein
MERMDIKQRTVPRVTRSNANTAVDQNTRKQHAGNLRQIRAPEWWTDTAAASADDGKKLL